MLYFDKKLCVLCAFTCFDNKVKLPQNEVWFLFVSHKSKRTQSRLIFF